MDLSQTFNWIFFFFTLLLLHSNRREREEKTDVDELMCCGFSGGCDVVSENARPPLR